MDREKETIQVSDVSKLTYTHRQGGEFRWITVSTLMLALGTILHLVSPSVGGVTPNWTIATYCVAIQLTRPTYKQALGIGLVASLINIMTSKSAFPYGNLLSEPAGALTAAFIVHAVSDFKIGRLPLKPFLSGFVATCVSGGIFITVLKLVMGLPLNVYLYVMIPLVATVGLANAVVTPILLLPAQKLFERRGFIGKDESANSNHDGYTLVPSANGAISVEHLSYEYRGGKGERVRALQDVNLAVRAGEFLAVTGPAGCGKSTLCLALTGAVPKFYGGTMTGMVFVNGKATTQQSIAELAMHVGVVLADYESQLVTMTVAEEVAFALENRGYAGDEVERRTADVLRAVGLAGTEGREVSGLSGGQRQRLAIASVLVTNPSILILDEPTSSLDPEGTAELYRIVSDLHKERGMTVVVIDHDLQAVVPYAERLVLMKDGAIAFDGEAADTLTYMYENGIYTDAIPPVFTTYAGLKRAGLALPGPWLGAESAKEALRAAYIR